MTTHRFVQPTGSAQLKQQAQQLRTAPAVHDVVNLKTGAVHSERLTAALTPATRTRRLAGIFPGLNDSIFGGPSFHLSARRPFIETPFCWLNANHPSEY